MRNQLVYDLPLRLFHWIFAGLFVSAFAIAKTIDDESIVFSYHMLAGLMLSFVVILRVVWGIFGSQHSRFSGFAFHPRELKNYFLGILSGQKRKWAGHNPASSWAGISMFALSLGLGTTGYLMATGQKETFEDIHELLANGFLVVVLLHVAGIILHTTRHKEAIGLSMVDGNKGGVESAQVISSSRPAIAVLFIVLVIAYGTYLKSHFNEQNRTLNLFGSQLQLGESEDNSDEAGDDD